METLTDRILITTLRFWIKKIKRGDCTMEQQKAVIDALASSGEVYGTVEEIAEFYGKSKDAVNGVIKRRYVGKPKRNVVLYSFSRFMKIAPKSWRADDEKSSG